MYLIERYMKILKGYVKNPYRPKTYIIERYIVEEEIEFCIQYLSNAEVIGIPNSTHEGRNKGRGTPGVRIVQKDQHEYTLILVSNFRILFIDYIYRPKNII